MHTVELKIWFYIFRRYNRSKYFQIEDKYEKARKWQQVFILKRVDCHNNKIKNNIAKLKLFIENTSKYSFYSNALITINHLKRIEDDISQGLQGPPCSG